MELQKRSSAGINKWYVLIMGFSGILFPIQSQAQAQAAAPIQAQAAPQEEKVEKLVTIIFQLKYAKPNSIVNVIQSLHGRDAICVAHEDTKAILLQAPEKTIQEVKELIQKLDVPQESETEGVFEIIKLKNVAPHEIENSLEMAQGNLDVEFALDEERGQLLVRGDGNSVKRFVSLIAKLDEPPVAKPPSKSRRVRIVWLVNDREENMELPPPPPDLMEVVAELQQIGITDLELMSQTMVQTLADGNFQISANLKFINGPGRLTIEGDLEEKSEGLVQVQINLEASTGTADRDSKRSRGGGIEQELCNLNTNVLAPLGHAVVLCLTPTDYLESAFVIQVLEGPAREPKK